MTNKNTEPQLFKSLFHIIAFILLFIVEQIPLSILALPKASLGSSYQSYIKMAPIISLILMIIVGFILYFTYKRSKQFTTQPFSIKTWITIIAGIVVALIINYGLIPFMRAQNTNVDTLNMIGQNSQIILIFSVLVTAPIFEELLFRGLIMNWFFVNRPMISILISGLVFGFAHAPISSNTDWVYAISKILLGLVLAIVYYKTKNIKASMTVHFLNNFLSIVLAM
ncbi:CPBP family intramembrane glutamic endopeptidase [Companilactobacillus furfuricola]|uniref:CPBP family intramembrane glutamic endopeptidase n=1 Tax=Companilactobacillus furfuricola TaxID=1462575 RepID=UPI000F7B2087|nr:type II CAAX endopeptidase family protein [Companilactobacillus furfuricola]